MVPKNIWWAFKLARIVGLVPWVNFEEKKFFYTGSQKIFKLTCIFFYLIMAFFATWLCFRDLQDDGSRMVIRVTTQILLTIYLWQMLIGHVFVDLKKWRLIFQLFKFKTFDEPMTLGPMVMVLVEITILIIHYTAFILTDIALLIKKILVGFWILILIIECFFKVCTKKLLVKSFEINNASLLSLSNGAYRDSLTVHRYVRACQIRESGNVYRDIVRLVRIYNSLLGKTDWQQITATVVLFLFLSTQLNGLSWLHFSRLLWIGSGIFIYLVSNL